MLLKRGARIGVRSHTGEVESHPLFRGKRKKPLREIFSIAADGNKDTATSEKCKPGAGLVSSLRSAAKLPAQRANCKCMDLDVVPPNCVCVCAWQMAGGGCAQTSLPRVSPASGCGHPGSSLLTACVFTPEGLTAKLLVCLLLNLAWLKTSR